MAYRSVAQRDSIGSVHQPSIYIYIYIYIYTGLQPKGIVPVIRYPVHRKHRLNSLRVKYNEIEKCMMCDLNDLVHTKLHNLK